MIFEKYNGTTEEWDSHYYSKGLNNRVLALTDGNGVPVEYYLYDPYGKVTVLDGSRQPIAGRATANPYLFQSRRLDEETGLYYFRNRYYSPDLGRFMQRDPLGYVDGMNLYEFVRGRPVVMVDPYGYNAIPSMSDIKHYIHKIKKAVDAGRQLYKDYRAIEELYKVLKSDDPEAVKQYIAKVGMKALEAGAKALGVKGVVVKFISGSARLGSRIGAYIAEKTHVAIERSDCTDCRCDEPNYPVGQEWEVKKVFRTVKCFKAGPNLLLMERVAPKSYSDNLIRNLMRLFEEPEKIWVQCP